MKLARLAVDIGGTFTDLALEHAGGARHDQGADHAGGAGAGRDGGRAASSCATPALRAGRHRHRHPRHDARHQRDHRAQGRAHRAAHHRGLSRRAGDGQREPLRPVRSQHRAARAAGAAASAPAGAGAAGQRRATCCCRSTRRRCARWCRCCGARRWKASPSASCTPSSIRRTSGASRDILAERLPDIPVSLSSEVSPEMREWERFSTTAANAYVQPLMARYLRAAGERICASIGVAAPIFLMLSGGGLTTIETACRFPIRLVESGPAGGAIFSADIARAMRPGQRAVVRHGRHDGQDLPDRRLPARRPRAASRSRGSGGSRRAPACRCASR